MPASTKIMKELENKTKEELLKMLFDLQQKLMIEKAKITSGISGENTSFVKNTRRKIARIKFILKNKYNFNI